MEQPPDANILAYLALLFTIPFTIVAFACFKPTKAVLLVLLGTQLFLPEVVCFDAPLVPPLNKQTLPALCMFVALLVTARGHIARARPGRGIDKLMMLALFAIIGTVVTNRDPLRYGPTTLPGHTPSDVLSEAIRMVLGPLTLFFLGRTLFRTSKDARDLLKGLVIAGLVYAPFIAIELRLSPQFHNWFYGFAQHDFGQTVRAGGWRPMVFMAHGLALALFVCATGLAGFSLSRARVPVFGMPASASGGFLTVLLALMHSMGALVYSIAITPLMWLLKPRGQLRVALFLAAIVATYPILRATALFPHQELVDIAARVSQDRAASLEFRFTHENLLLERARERPWFGWGGFARSHIHDERGVDQSVVDGAWIGVLAGYGIIGFIARFGLLLVPILMAKRTISRLPSEKQALLAGISLIAGVYSLDLLPNGMFNELPMFFAGTVSGLSQGMLKEHSSAVSPELALRVLGALRELQPSVGARRLRA